MGLRGGGAGGVGPVPRRGGCGTVRSTADLPSCAPELFREYTNTRGGGLRRGTSSEGARVTLWSQSVISAARTPSRLRAAPGVAACPWGCRPISGGAPVARPQNVRASHASPRAPGSRVAFLGGKGLPSPRGERPAPSVQALLRLRLRRHPSDAAQSGTGGEKSSWRVVVTPGPQPRVLGRTGPSRFLSCPEGARAQCCRRQPAEDTGRGRAGAPVGTESRQQPWPGSPPVPGTGLAGLGTCVQSSPRSFGSKGRNTHPPDVRSRGAHAAGQGTATGGRHGALPSGLEPEPDTA